VSCGKENGTGLGLTIAYKIVHDHGGQLRVASTSPQGTTFELTLPLHRQLAAAGALQAAAVSDAQHSP